MEIKQEKMKEKNTYLNQEFFTSNFVFWRK